MPRAGELDRLGDDFRCIEERQQIVCLKDVADPGESQPPEVAAEVPRVENGFAVEAHPAARGLDYAGNHVEQRSLAATGRAAQAEHLVSIHRKCDVEERLVPGLCHPDPGQARSRVVPWGGTTGRRRRRLRYQAGISRVVRRVGARA